MDAMTTNSASSAPALHPSAIPLDAYWPTILNEIEGGRSLREIMETPGFPRRDWAMQCLRKSAELRTQYEAACRGRAILLADEILTISDAPIPEDLDPACRASHVAQKRLMVDSRKWITAKLYPKVFGDRTMVEVKDDYRSISIIAAMKQRELVAVGMLREWNEKDALDVEPRMVDGPIHAASDAPDDDDGNEADEEMST